MYIVGCQGALQIGGSIGDSLSEKDEKLPYLHKVIKLHQIHQKLKKTSLSAVNCLPSTYLG